MTYCIYVIYYHLHFHYNSELIIYSLKSANLFFGHFELKFSLKMLLSFSLIFYQFEPGVTYKSIAYKKRV